MKGGSEKKEFISKRGRSLNNFYIMEVRVFLRAVARKEMESCTIGEIQWSQCFRHTCVQRFSPGLCAYSSHVSIPA